MGCTIAGTGHALPGLTVRNDDLATIVDTSDEWIVKRTGIRSRRIAGAETTTELAVRAARAALSAAKRPAHDDIDPASIDLVVCATITPDTVIPSQAAMVKRELGLSRAVAFDVNAACAGCVYGISVAEGMMATARAHGVPASRNDVRRALVIGAERMSRVVDWTDRSTCVLFGDGAGAVVLEWSEEHPGIISSFLRNDDDDRLSLALANPLENETFPFGGAEPGPAPDAGDGGGGAFPFVTMDGRSVFKFATAAMAEAIEEVLRRAHMSLDEVGLIVPHQANERIIANVARKIGLPLERFQLSIGHCANTSAASALIALDEAYAQGRIRPGGHVIMVGFGGGFTSGAVLFASR